jgi:hypothetical protein
MGSDESSPIQVNEDLTKSIGETLNWELVNRLNGNQNTSTGAISGVTSGITGYNTLEGNEEALGIRTSAHCEPHSLGCHARRSG